MRHFSWLCRWSGRHAVTSCHLRRYGIFWGYADYPADTRKANNSIDLWPIQFSDCRADTRKLNVNKELWQASIFAKGGGACALLCAQFGSMGESRSRGVKRTCHSRVQTEYILWVAVSTRRDRAISILNREVTVCHPGDVRRVRAISQPNC